MRLIQFILILLIAACSKLKLEPANSNRDFFIASWIKNLDPTYDAGNLPIGIVTPKIHQDTLFVADKRGFFTAYDLSSGRIKWEFNEGVALGGKAEVNAEQVVYTSMSGRVFSRNIQTGELNFAIDLKYPIESAPTFHQGRMFLHLRNHQVMSLDAMTGKILWSYKRAVSFSTTLQKVSRPTVIDNKLLVGFADGHLGAFQIEEGILLWETKLSFGAKFIDVDLNAIIFNDMLVICAADGPLSFLSPTDGKILFTREVVAGHTPLIRDGNLIFGSNAGEIVVIDGNGMIQYQIPVSDSGISSLTVWRAHYVAASFKGELLQIDAKTLAVRSKFQLGSKYSTVFGDLVTDNNHLAVYSSRNRLYVFK